MKKIAILILAGQALWAVDKGDLGYDYLRIPPSVNGHLFMYSMVAYPHGADILNYNPALMSEREADFAASSYIAGVKLGSLSLSSGGKWGLSLFYLTSGTMDEIDENGEVTGSFSTSHLAIGAARKEKLRERMDVGATFKLLYQGIDGYSSFALAFDLGVSYRPGREGLTFGASLRNLGYEVKPFVDERAMLPTELLLGAVYEIGSLTLGAGISSALDQPFALSLTGLWSPSPFLEVGLGYTTERGDLKTGGERDILNGLSAGFNASVRGVHVGYSYTPFGDFGDIHTLSLGYSFAR